MQAARVGMLGAPLIVLGGGGAMPVRGAEDAPVVDVAVAGCADVVVTGNFADFVSYRTDVVRAGRGRAPGGVRGVGGGEVPAGVLGIEA